MGIIPNQYPVIWRAIRWWMKKRLWNSDYLARLIGYSTGYSKERIDRGLRDGTEQVTSDLLHACVDVFGTGSSRQRGPEDTTDILTDEECIQALIEPLLNARQASLWDNP